MTSTTTTTPTTTTPADAADRAAVPDRQAPASFRNRIVGEGEVDPRALRANPENWRRHPPQQMAALRAMMDEVGWVQRVVVNRTTGNMVDGHARVELAIQSSEPTVPVIYVELSQAEERLVLAALDPLGGLATTDQAALDSLLAQVHTTGESALDMLLSDLASDSDPGGAQQQARDTLRGAFLVPPFSVLDARQAYWQDRKRAWLALGIRSDEGRAANLLGPGLTMLNAIKGSGLNGTSVFDPTLCELVYRWFAPPDAQVLDPFAGGSVRGAVAALLGHRYIGIELRSEQCTANEGQWATMRHQTLDDRPAPTPRWICADSRDLGGMDIPDADLVFSCPPYADLEVYSDDPRDLSRLRWPDFATAYSQIIGAACARLKPNRFAVFVVGEVRDGSRTGAYLDFVGETIRAFRAAGLTYYNEAVLVTAVGTLAMRAAAGMLASRKLGKTHQQALVFLKGDQPDAGGKGQRAKRGALIDALSEATAQAFAADRQAVQAHVKMLVFANGDPAAAAAELGAPPMDDAAGLLDAAQ